MKPAAILAVLLIVFGAVFSAVSAADCEIIVDKELYDAGEKMGFKPKVEGVEDYVIEYWIEFLDGSFAKKPKNTTNTNKKSFTPKKEGKYIIKMVVKDACTAEKTVVIGSAGGEVWEKEDRKESEEGGQEKKNTLRLNLVVHGVESGENNPYDYAFDDSASKKSKKPAKTSKTSRPKSKAAALTGWFLLFLLTLFCVILIWRR
jgi:hypothetical protein